VEEKKTEENNRERDRERETESEREGELSPEQVPKSGHPQPGSPSKENSQPVSQAFPC
jgi:hypothetical protein